MRQPFVGLINDSGDRSACFAIRLRAIAERVAPSTPLELEESRSRHVGLVTALGGLAESLAFRLRYQIRYLAEPSDRGERFGTVRIALLTKLNGTTDAALAADVAASVASTLDSLVEGCDFEAVADEQEFRSLFIADDLAEAVEIIRREATLDLSSLVQEDTPAAGFGRGTTGRLAGRPLELDAGRIPFVFPFVPTGSSLERLLRALAAQRHRVCVVAHMQPTALTAVEQRVLADVLASCQHRLTFPTQPAHGGYSLALSQQALAIHTAVYGQFMKLRERAFVLRLCVASDGPIPPSLIDSVGHEVTRPPGVDASLSSLSSGLLSGGYAYADRQRSEAGWSDLKIIEGDRPFGDGERYSRLVGAAELSGAFRFPGPIEGTPPGFRTRFMRHLPVPEVVATAGGIVLGHDSLQPDVPVHLARDDRRRHMYIVGQTGTGKTTLIESLAMQDILAGEGVAMLDPHGDLFEKLLGQVPSDRIDDVVVVDPSDADYPLALNFLQYESEEEKLFLIQELQVIIQRLVANAEFTGPVFHHYVRLVLLLLMNDPDRCATLLDFYRFFLEPDSAKRWLPLKHPDPLVELFAKREQFNFKMGSETPFFSYIISKFDGFVSDLRIRNVVGQKRSTLRFEDIVDGGKILLVNLSKGRIGELNSAFLGMLVVSKLQSAVLKRVGQDKAARRDFYVYVDEFQNLATDTFSTLLSEARKFRLSLILSNQFKAQIPGPVSAAIVGNVGSTIALRVGQDDARFLAKDFAPRVSQYDLADLPNFYAYVSTLRSGETVRPFSMRIARPQYEPDPHRAAAVREASRQKYARARQPVEAEIAAAFAG
jgi:hypothetical protein